MSIGGVSNTNQVQTAHTISGGGLTPDALMLYCASQLNHLDDGIKAKMMKQEGARKSQDALGQLKDKMSRGDIAANDNVQKEAIINEMKATYAALPPGDPGRDRLNQLFHDFIHTACLEHGKIERGDTNLWNCDAAALSSNSAGINNVSIEEMKSFCTSIDGIIGDVSKGAELEMINLQSMVSQRQMAIQVTTQMLSKVNESLMSIINGYK